MSTIERIAVYTSGGDAPGMNACLRAVVRSGLSNNLEVFGIHRGYKGLIEGDFVKMTNRKVSNILQKGGTVLKSARCKRFYTEEGRAEAAEKLRSADIDALVALGGDGSLRGAYHLSDEHNIPVVGCPCTIDNDLPGTDETIGFDTALNTTIANLDRIRDTASAHNRLFLVEVMGRDTGFIALNSGIGGGAELILIPETRTKMADIKERIYALMGTKERSSIAIVAEGEELGGAVEIGEALRNDPKFDDIELRVCVLGHVQRGGAPSVRDRVLASRLGVSAVEALLEGHSQVMVGLISGDTKLTPLPSIWDRKKRLNHDLLRLPELLS